MNKLKAKVTNINNFENLNLVEFSYNNFNLSMVSLELAKNIKIGTIVNLSVKSTQIAISREISKNISYSNQIKDKIKNIDNGEILSSITLRSGLESIITLNSSKKMNLQNNEEVILLIKETELSILEVLND
jgi:molybdopterin-binding protein